MFFKSRNITEAEVRKALAHVQHPLRGSSITELEMVSGVVIRQGKDGASVTFVLDMAEGDESVMERLRTAGEEAVRTIKGVTEARALFTATGTGPAKASPAAPKKPQPASPRRAALDVKHLGKIIAVISGKGGVGKSTVSANLACALVNKGLRVGLLDADVYGPSVPRLFGLTDKPETRNGKLIPLEKYGLKLMSMGFMVGEQAPVIWRGAMVQMAIRQMLQDVEWGELDALVIDMPPGTGDAQLTLAQSVPLAGSVIVSTPQDLALIDARKALAMFRRLEVPILGLIENMSTFICDHCGQASNIFGHGGVRKEAAEIGEDFLSEIPLTLRLRETSDAGTPLTAIEPQSETARRFQLAADVVWNKLQNGNAKSRALPTFVVEE
jgi:ATP-binding protein involved in chromosome partitioning